MPEKKTITFEEFLEMKRQEARQMALANSYNATEPRLAKRYADEKYVRDLNTDIFDAEQRINELEKDIKEIEGQLFVPFRKDVSIFKPEHLAIGNDKKYVAGLNADGDFLLDKLGRRQHALKWNIDLLKESKENLKSINEKGYDWTGWNCITNATGWYGDPYVCASNIQFKENPAKYGFVEINVDDALPGDILQIENENVPYHAIMYSKKGDQGERLSNYSNGHTDAEALKRDSAWWGYGDRAYRFIGLPEDIEIWTREYNDTYGQKKLGGMKKIKQKKMLGAAIIGAATSLIGTGLNLAQQKRIHDEQMAQQQRQLNIQNANTRIANLNELVNNDMNWAYDKFRPAFKCGGKKRIRAKLGKFKSRF